MTFGNSTIPDCKNRRQKQQQKLMSHDDDCDHAGALLIATQKMLSVSCVIFLPAACWALPAAIFEFLMVIKLDWTVPCCIMIKC